jgi:hypothetical protein
MKTMSEGVVKGSGDGMEPPGRISLRRLDALLLGELGPEEAAALRRAVDADPAARAYLARQASLRSSLSAQKLRAAVAASRRGPLTRLAALLEAQGRGPFRFAAGAFACVALGLAVWTHRPASLPGEEMERAFRAKGDFPPEVVLRLHGRDFAPGSLVPARAGDTLAFSYRSGEGLHAQAWYREAGGEVTPFEGARSFALPVATSWTEAPQRLLLSGAWSRQEVWILLSPRPLDAETAARAVRRGKDGDGVRVLAYRLSAIP